MDANETRRVLITGGMGFVGGHLAEMLLHRGDSVTALDDLSTGSRRNVAHLTDHERFHAVWANVEDDVVLDRLVSEADVVFHLAATVGVRLIVEDPMRCITTNIGGTEKVLAAAARYNAKVLIASTSEVYGKGSRIPFCEDDDVVLGATSRSRWSYAASKMVDEFLGLAYHQQAGVPVVVFRLFNTVGPRQTGQYGMVVPRFVRAALRGRPLTVYGDGEQSRCFMHVHDAVDALVRLSLHPEAVGQVFNIGATEQVTILELARRVLDAVGAPSSDGQSENIQFVPYEEAYPPGFEDMRERTPDTTKIHALTGWAPAKNLADIITDVIADERRAQDVPVARVPDLLAAQP